MSKRTGRNPIRWHGEQPTGDYAQIPNKLACDGRLTPQARSVALYLWCHRDGFTVSDSAIAKHTGIGRNTVQEVIAELADAGWLVVKDYGSHFEYHMHRSGQLTNDGLHQPVQSVALTSASSCTDESTNKTKNKTNKQAAALVDGSPFADHAWKDGLTNVAATAMEDDGATARAVKAALDELPQRDDAEGPGFLKVLISDAMKHEPKTILQTAYRTGDMSQLAQLGYHWNPPDPPINMLTVDEMRVWMLEQKRHYIAELREQLNSEPVPA